ncbi:MAG: recombination protein RecR [Clostridia bacterium]|nr:recombination protein RecR [Clostridia bacterium]
MNTVDSMEKLIYSFTKLPGVGRKTAERYAYKVLDMSEEDVRAFAENLVMTKQNVKYCSVCGNFTENEVCNICQNRHSDIICVVKEPKDIIAIEKTKSPKFVYHVLHGTINPMENKGPNDIRIKELLGRLEGVTEVILATNPDVEGEVTANYIAKLLKPLGVKTTRLATGIQMGSDLQYADEVTLSKAFEDRKEIS